MKIKIDGLDISREITEGSVVSVGRQGYGADIQLDLAGVSREHADIKLENGEISILDKKSKNQTLLNGQPIIPEVWQTVMPGDKVVIVGFDIRFIKSEIEVRPEPQQQLNTEPNPGPSKNTGKVKVDANLNDRFRELLNLKLPIKIGRLATNDIVLPDAVADDRVVGRTHAEISYRDGRYWVEDLNSKNGTYVNGERIPAGQPKAIEGRDAILIHLHYFSVEDGYRDLREEMAIRAEGISKTYANGFVGLNPMSVEIPRNQIVALMGPSGCGKSTLLKALNGDSPATSGDVYIHGLSLRENYNLLKQKIGYVPQDDTIHHELTVEQTLYMAAKLRLPDDTTNADIEQRIAEVLHSLNFEDKVRDKKVGGLSGGQRKRICIAVELLSRPTILFLDEPTSPLDPETIEKFLISLRDLARNGTTIVMVTHKPEDLTYSDKVVFMAAKGYFVYYGSKNGETGKFDGLTEKFNVDHIIKVYTKCGDNDESADSENIDIQRYYIKPAGHIIQRPPGKLANTDKQKSLLLQFFWLAKRYLSIKISDRYNLYLLLAQPFIIAGLVSFIFHEVNVQVMMLIAISAIWFGVSNSSKEIVGEYAVYKRERMFNLSIHTYILSKWVVLSLIALVQVVIYIAIIHLFFSKDILGGYLPNVAFMFYITSSATLFGLFLSSYFNTTEKVLTVVPIALMPQIMLAGVVEQIHSVKVDVLSYFTLGRWGTEGMLRLQKENFSRPLLGKVFYDEGLKNSGGWIVTLFDGLGANIFIMLLISVIMYALTYVSLKRRDTI